MKLKFNKTNRGFSHISFKDRYKVKCNIQKSSLATENAFWIGVEDANPIILASDCSKLGVKTDKDSGWIKYDIPNEVSLTTRMHLTQDQVIELLLF